MEIVVNDTNIFIDLCDIDLLEKVFQLPLEIHTVDFVISELTDSAQLERVSVLIANHLLTVHSFSVDELSELYDFHAQASGNVSVIDCAAWLYAMNNGYTLITGDARLRKQAEKARVKVCGILYLFDMLVEHKILSPDTAADKLSNLFERNPRLPKGEILERIGRWSG